MKSYLYQVMGFFVVEDTILHTTQGLITREILDDWWAMVIVQMVTLLRTACVSQSVGCLTEFGREGAMREDMMRVSERIRA